MRSYYKLSYLLFLTEDDVIMSEDFRKKLVSEILEFMNEEQISTDPAINIAYTRDSSFVLSGISETDFIVVQPKSTGEVKKIIDIANKYNLKIVIKTTGTNLSGITLPYMTHILLDLKRMNNIIEIDKDSQVVIIEPGVTHGQLAREAAKNNLKYIGPEAPYSSSVIGNIAFTAMKPGATVYGQDQVLALEIVLPNGEILKTGCWAFPDLEDVTPYYRHAPLIDLNTLFTFTRGVFGIITKAAIRLYPMQEEDLILVAGFQDINNMVNLARKIQYYNIPTLLMATSGSYLPRLLTIPVKKKIEGYEYPPHLLIIEIEGTKEQVETDLNIVKRLLEKFEGAIIDVPDEKVRGILPPSKYSPRMLQPYGSMIPSICYAPTTYTGNFIMELRKFVEERYNLHTEYVVYFQYRGLNTYVEVDIHYDPLEEGIREKIISLLREASKIKKRYKCCSTSLSAFKKTGVYYDLAMNIKKMIDPNLILNMGRLFKEV